MNHDISIKKIKEMLSEQADKKWFKKHGLPKNSALAEALKKKLRTKDWPKIKDGEDPFGKTKQRGGLPPGYKQRDLE